MTVQITIIGTGQIGASIGLALGEHKDLFIRVGHDKDIRVANQAKDMGALDRVDINLPNSVAEAADRHPGAAIGPDSGYPQIYCLRFTGRSGRHGYRPGEE